MRAVVVELISQRLQRAAAEPDRLDLCDQVLSEPVGDYCGRDAEVLCRRHALPGEVGVIEHGRLRRLRSLDARKQLETAYEMFMRMGSDVYAERAARELLATEQRVRRPDIETARKALTAQEAEVCRLAAEGSTNAEIAAKLHLSASTVDYHLRKSFTKLGIRSRAQLAGRLSQ